MLHNNAMRLAKRTFVLLTLLVSSVNAADSPKSEKTQPQPVSLTIPTGDVQLKGRRDTSQVIVSGILPGEKRADFTRAVSFSSSDPAVVKISKTGQLQPASDG